MKKVAAAVALFAVALSATPASAQSAFQGFHVGVNVGPTMSDVELSSFGSRFDAATQGFVGGGSLGYSFSLGHDWLLDLEGMVDYASSDSNVMGLKLEQGLGYGASASLGYMITRNNAIYGKFGFEMRDFKAGDITKTFEGFQFGAGTRWALDSNWSLKAEYLYTMYLSSSIAGIDVKPASNSLRIGVDYRFY
jgi:opacity protein-like surface antigen